VRSRSGAEVLLYFVFEREGASQDGAPMGFRLLRAQVQIWEEWSARHPGAERLPRIVPIVMYQGSAPWSEPRQFSDLIAVPPAVRQAIEPYLVKHEYLVLELSAISDVELREQPMNAVAKLVELCCIRQGMRAGECAALLRLLRQRFGREVDAGVEQRLAAAPIEQIEAWTDRVLSAASLADVLVA
jgi:hypothetical protein